MVEAYVLLNVMPGYEVQTVEKLKSIKGVSEVDELYGEWDAILKIQAGTLEEMNGILTDKIRSVKEIKETSTMIVAKYKR